MAKQKNRLAALLGLVITLVSRLIFVSFIFLISSVFAITLVLVFLRNKLEL